MYVEASQILGASSGILLLLYLGKAGSNGDEPGVCRCRKSVLYISTTINEHCLANQGGCLIFKGILELLRT
jgi:hypothetical protein